MHREIPNLPTTEALQRLAGLPGCLLLDSAKAMFDNSSQPLGRYSFLMADPFAVFQVPVGTRQPLAPIEALLKKYPAPTIPGLPPMQGGVAGLFSYDLNHSFESLAPAQYDEFQLPSIVVGAYDVVIAWDHQVDKTWIISQGFPAIDPSERRRRARDRADFFYQRLTSSSANADDASNRHSGWHTPASNSIQPPEILQPNPNTVSVQHPNLPKLASNFTRQQYISAVQKCIDYILAGDVFQVNLSQRLLHPANTDSVSLYRRLRACNPAPFAGYFDLSNISDSQTQIISASPERLISVRDRQVETRPIKGTRRRTGQPLIDIRQREQLRASEKDRSENTMIVDLMRNDLARVCNENSIVVSQLCAPESYQSVMHLVSAVLGTLKPDTSVCDLLAAVFPGGSITGAPKIRAMQIIAEIESIARGAYCGSLGYLGFDGTTDLNILIRTITASGGWWQIPVGGGVVAQSSPDDEYNETWTKAAAMLQAIDMTGDQSLTAL